MNALLPALLLSLIPPSFDELDYSRCPLPAACEVTDQTLRLRLFPGQERSEARDLEDVPFGASREYLLAFSIPPETRLETVNHSLVIAQFKARNDHSPPLALRWKGDGTYTITIRHRVDSAEDRQGEELELYRGPIEQDKTVWFRIQVRSGTLGALRIEQDGIEVVRYVGPLGYLNTPNYFKFGPYDYTRTQASPLEIRYIFYGKN